MNSIQSKRFLFGAFLSAFLCGCGGAAGTRGVSGLEIASEMSVVTAQEVSSSPAISSLPTLGLKLKAITSDTSTAYYTDPLNTWVYDDSMQSLDIINEILCAFDQTRYDESTLVNLATNSGNYVAMIDNDLCSKQDSKAGETNNQSTGANAEDLERWVVNSSRASDSSPHIVTVWIKEAGDEFEPAKIIQAKVTISEGKSATSPFGKFHLDFKMVDAATQLTELAHGILRTVDRTDGKVEFEFFMDGTSGFDVSEIGHVIMDNADGTSGVGYSSHAFNMGAFSESAAFYVAYNEGNYLTLDQSSTRQCLNRTSFDSNVYRYGVYNENGSRLTIANGGFGIKPTAVGSEDKFGWAGYYGIWFDDSVTVANGMKVARSNNDSTEATYTVFDAPGKLIKHTRSTVTLSQIKNVTLYYWNNGTNNRAKWNGSQFVLDGIETCDDTGCTFTDQTETALSCTVGEFVNFWRDGFGSLFFDCDGTTLTDSSTIFYDAQTVMNPDSTEVSGGITLSCYRDCPKANITEEQINWQNDETPFLTDLENEDLATPYTYTLNPSDMTLKRGGDSIVLESGASASDGPNSWGINSGPMLTDTSGLESVWDVWGESTYYTWETGPNQWNHLQGLLSGESWVVFDPPTKLDYTHTNSDSSTTKYLLDYAAFGELHGIPWQEDSLTGRWYPLITIPDGATATNGSTTYTIRALDMEQSMQEASLSECSALTLNTSISVPDGKSYVDPALTKVPTVTDDPKVIKGQLTGS